MNSTQTVPAILYDIRVYSPLLPFNPAGDFKVKEIFIPSINVIINSGGSIFHSEKPRNKNSHRGVQVENLTNKIHLPFEYVEKIKNLAKLKLEVDLKEKEIKKDSAPYFI